MKKMTGLGRGLDALIDTSHVDTNGGSSISEIELAKIVANPDQPRRTFDEEALQELADSIREHGVISPITLRDNGDDTYMIIAGERRFRASKMAGLERIPAYIRTAKDEQVMEWALIENIQREDLDAIEIALAYQRLMVSSPLSRSVIGEMTPCSRHPRHTFGRTSVSALPAYSARRTLRASSGSARARRKEREETRQTDPQPLR